MSETEGDAEISFSDLERSLGIATEFEVVFLAAAEGFSDLERSLGIATVTTTARRWWSGAFQ